MRRGLVVVGVAGVAAAGLLWLRRRARARRIPDSEEAKRGVVADAYTATAKGEQLCCVSVKKGDAMGYSAADRALSATAGSDLGLGCGNPVELANLAEGEVVVDLGCGAGAVGPCPKSHRPPPTPRLSTHGPRPSGRPTQQHVSPHPGIDCLLAASRVGERGRAIGVDMVAEMPTLTLAHTLTRTRTRTRTRTLTLTLTLSLTLTRTLALPER